MTSLIIGVLLVVGGAMVGIAIERVRLRRWLSGVGTSPRGRDPASHTGPGRRWSVRHAVEDVHRRAGVAETARLSAETAEQRISSSLDVLQSGLVVCDRSGQVVARNSAATKLLQARHGEALVAGVIKDLLERARTGERVTANVDLHAEPRRSYEVEAGPVERDGEMLGAVALVRDTTEHHRIESVRRDFVANVSHELKTPIGALSLLADSLAADSDPEVASHLAGRMQIEIQRVANTIDDLLTLATLEDESGRSDAQVDVGAVVAAAVDRISETADQNDIKVILSNRTAAAAIRGSRLHLESAVFNLLDNAVKFSESGGQVDVVVEADQEALTVSVTDEGIGIPAMEQTRIFERFYRVDRARSRSTGGTGLGLSIVRHVALNHGGDVSVTSREGFGAKFTVTLPLDNGN